MITYFDTSALVKLLVTEPGTDVAAEVWDASEQRVTSLVTYAEARAALSALHRSRRSTADAHRTSRLLLEERWDQLGLIQITDAIVHLAGDLADRDALRGYDAVHLASALTAGDGAELLMVTWDDALGGAALNHGASLAPAPVPTSNDPIA